LLDDLSDSIAQVITPPAISTATTIRAERNLDPWELVCRDSIEFPAAIGNWTHGASI